MTRTVASEFIGVPPSDVCTRCGSVDLVECCASTTVWRDNRPFLIEAIPSLRCEACGETLIKGGTAELLDQICSGLPDIAAGCRTLDLPVVSFPEAAVPPRQD